MEPLDDAAGDTPHRAPTSEPLAPGARVEVRNRLDGRWTRGFEVIERSDDGYRLRRQSDGMTLPLPIPEADVRRERRGGGTWWY